MVKSAKYWETEEDEVVCRLCPHECRLQSDQRGICGCRFNSGGKLVTENYGEAVTVAVDPIEKKPLYHFYPGTTILSTGANGCNFACENCQNWTISQSKTITDYISPKQLVNIAQRHNSIGVAFTYTEPMIWFEYIMDTAPLLRAEGLKVVLVSNGFINPEPLAELLNVIDAVNVDLKSMSPDFYRRICKGQLEPVLKNIKAIAASKVHLELTNLIIPDMNSSPDDIHQLVDWVAEIDPLIPVHFSAYHPSYKMKTRATSMAEMMIAFDIARKKLKYVFLGNVNIDDSSNTNCPECGHLLINRAWYDIRIVGLEGTKCAQCGAESGIVL